jgi:hypothetical protein
MKRNLIIIVTVGLLTSCGLTSKYQNAQHSVYAKMLTTDEMNTINQKGEITRDIEFNDPNDNRLLKGKLRILKTDRQDVFNFVEIGEWIDHGRLGNSGKYHNLEYRDTTFNDNLGNSISRVVYDKDKQNKFSLGERWTSKPQGDSFIRHIEIFKDRVLISEYDLKLQDFNNPKSDIQKKKIPTGTRKDYSPSGQLISTKTFDNNGQLIK